MKWESFCVNWFYSDKFAKVQLFPLILLFFLTYKLLTLLFIFLFVLALIWVLIPQFRHLKTTSTQTLCLAVIAVLLAVLLLFPYPTCSLWVGFSILLIDVGILGYGAFWGVYYDSSTAIILLVSVGVSVHYSIHISHAFFSSTREAAGERMRDGLFIVGCPLLLGAVCSAVSVLPFLSVSSGAFRAIFKMFLLATGIGIGHSLVLLPVMLSLLGAITSSRGEVKPLMDGSQQVKTTAQDSVAAWNLEKLGHLAEAIFINVFCIFLYTFEPSILIFYFIVYLLLSYMLIKMY